MKITVSLLTVFVVLTAFSTSNSQSYDEKDEKILERKPRESANDESPTSLYDINDELLGDNDETFYDRPSRGAHHGHDKGLLSGALSALDLFSHGKYLSNGIPVQHEVVQVQQQPPTAVQCVEGNGIQTVKGFDISSFFTQCSSILETVLTEVTKLISGVAVAFTNLKTKVDNNQHPETYIAVVDDVEVINNSFVDTTGNIFDIINTIFDIFNLNKRSQLSDFSSGIQISGTLERIRSYALQFFNMIKQYLTPGTAGCTGLAQLENFFSSLSCNNYAPLDSLVNVAAPVRPVVSDYTQQTTTSQQFNLFSQVNAFRNLWGIISQLPTIINGIFTVVTGVLQTATPPAPASRPNDQVPQYIVPPRVVQQPVYQVPIYQAPAPQPIQWIPNVGGSAQISVASPGVSASSQGQLSLSPIRDIVTGIGTITNQFNRRVQQQFQVPAPSTRVQMSPSSGSVTCSAPAILDRIRQIQKSRGTLRVNTNEYYLNPMNKPAYTRTLKNCQLMGATVSLRRSDLSSLLSGSSPSAGDIILLNLTDDIVIVGQVTAQDYVTFNVIYKKISHKVNRAGGGMLWNLSSEDFTCNPQIYNYISEQVANSKKDC